MRQLGVFTQVPTVRSLTNALLEEKLILPSKEPDHKLYKTRINKVQVRGWMFIPDWNIPDGIPTGNQKPDTGDPSSRFSRVPGEKEREVRERKIERIWGDTPTISQNIAGTPGTSGTNRNNNVTDIDSSIENSSRTCSRRFPKPTNNSDGSAPLTDTSTSSDGSVTLTALSPETKHSLWMSIGRALRKEPRKDGRNLGVTLSSLDPDVKLPSSQIVQHLTANGWTSSKVDPGGLVIWWAPEKVLKAYGLEV